MVVDAAGVLADTPEEPAEIEPDSVRRLSILELEFNDLFTEVCESI